MHPKVCEGFGLFAIVKETGVDDEGLVEFHDKYFPHTTYRDQSWTFYEALGNRKVGFRMIFNPFTLFSLLCETFQRLREKKIEGNVKGEGLVQGGIIFFGRDGRVKYAYQEETGVDLRVRDIVAAMEAIRREADEK